MPVGGVFIRLRLILSNTNYVLPSCFYDIMRYFARLNLNPKLKLMFAGLSLYMLVMLLPLSK